MQKPNSYDTTQAAGEFEPIKLGGHKMVIKQVSERQSQGGLNMIVVLFDFADGDEFVCWILGAKISDINVAMIAIFYIGDCISDLAKAIERRSEK